MTENPYSVLYHERADECGHESYGKACKSCRDKWEGETVEGAFVGVQSMKDVISDRLQRLTSLFYNVFKDDAYVQEFRTYAPTPSHWQPVNVFNVTVDNGEAMVEGYPAHVLDRSDEDITAMWQVAFYDLHIDIVDSWLLHDVQEFSSDFMEKVKSVDFDPVAARHALESIEKMRKDKKETESKREELMKSVKDADALSKAFGIIR